MTHCYQLNINEREKISLVRKERGQVSTFDIR